MIYLLESVGYDLDNNLEIIPGSITRTLKIGYTSDTGFNQRLNSYTTSNPGIKTVATILGATMEHEFAVHKYFKKYKYNKNREWYYFNDKIVKFFKTATINTLDGLVSKFPKTSNGQKEKFISEHVLEITYILKSLGYPRLESRNKAKEILGQSGNNFINTINTIKTMFDPADVDKFSEKWKPENTDKETYSIVTKLEEEKLMEVRIKKLCEYQFSSNDIKLDTLNRLKNDIDYYYTYLGTDRCRALGYNVTKLNKEIGISVFDKSDLEAQVKAEFIVGKAYPKSYIKDKLAEIYKNVGYEKVAKAIDLGEWFVIRKTMILNSNRERISSFKIIS